MVSENSITAFVRLDIATPEALILSEKVESVVLPGVEGEMKIFPRHAALMTALKPGELICQQGQSVTRFAIGSGFLEVTGQTIVVLTDMAVPECDIDEQRIARALEEAEARLAILRRESDVREIKHLQDAILKYNVQLQIKRDLRELRRAGEC